MEDFMTLARSRYSVRKFENKPLEEAVLQRILTAGQVAPTACNNQAVHVYVLSGEGLHVGEAYATAVVLMVIVFLMNALSSWIAKRCNRNS